ncbi:AMP-binding protein, partial [Streptomyces sp. NPDC057062]
SVWAVLMQRYCLSDKIIFGTTVSGRIPEIQGMENMVGMFINTLPMCIALDGVSTVELVKTVHQQLISRKEYEYMPYTEIQEISNKNGDVPLFHTIVAIENYPLPEGNNHFLSVESIHETTNYMLALEAMFSDKLAFKIIYRNSIPRHEVSALASRFKNILEAFLVDDNKRIDQIKIISEKERKEIIEIGTQQTDYPFDKTINDLFKEQVLRYPHKTALITDKVSLTYNQLDEMASKLACHMMATGVQKESIIGIVTERSHETIVSILAAIKTGCTYLPIDPHYPLDRVKNILHDSNAHILILPDCSEFNSNELSFPNIIRYDSLTFNCDSDVKSFWDISPNNAAYVMYTSGSTGSPKGVVVEHKSVVRLVKNSLTFPMNENGKILQTGSIAFDAATFEIWGALLNGQCLIIRNKLLALDAVMLSREVAEQQITTLW